MTKYIASLIIFLFASCHKEITVTSIADKSDLVTKVSTWLDAQKVGSKNSSTGVQVNSVEKNGSSTNGAKNANIDLLKNSLDYSSALQSDISDKSDYIIVPINDDVKEKKHVDANASLALLLVTNKAGKIISGNIACYIPKDGKSRGAKDGAAIVAAIMKGKAPKDSGMLKMMDVAGRRLHEIGFKNGLLSSYGIITNKKKDASTATNSSCTDWYLVTTYYDQYGVVINQTWDYVGTTCEGCDSADYMSLCPGGDGGSGGTGSGSGDSGVTNEWTEDVDASTTADGTFVDPDAAPDGSGLSGMPNEPKVNVRCSFLKIWNTINGVDMVVDVNIFPAQIFNPTVDFLTTNGVMVTRDAWFSVQRNSAKHLTLTTLWVEWNAGLHLDYGWWGGQQFDLQPFRQVKVG